MDRTERFYRMTQLLEARTVVPRKVFLEELGVSLATLKRDLEYLRDRLSAPIVWDAERRGYRFDAPAGATPRFELPGLWFSADEARTLLTLLHLIDSIRPGDLPGLQLRPLRSRIEVLLGKGDHSAAEVRRRIRILPQAARQVSSKHFELLSNAVLTRRRLRITHYSRARDDEVVREVSPQRLVYYRDNWYLDTWCHLREAVRCFSLESIREAQLLDKAARRVPEATLDEELGSSYGIFTGKADKIARLRFTPERARWVASEYWHPRQKGRFDGEGHYLLEIPYRNDRELIMDILRHGRDVTVLAPPSLREGVRQALKASLAQY